MPARGPFELDSPPGLTPHMENIRVWHRRQAAQHVITLRLGGNVHLRGFRGHQTARLGRGGLHDTAGIQDAHWLRQKRHAHHEARQEQGSLHARLPRFLP